MIFEVMPVTSVTYHAIRGTIACQSRDSRASGLKSVRFSVRDLCLSVEGF